VTYEPLAAYFDQHNKLEFCSCQGCEYLAGFILAWGAVNSDIYQDAAVNSRAVGCGQGVPSRLLYWLQKDFMMTLFLVGLSVLALTALIIAGLWWWAVIQMFMEIDKP